MEMPYQDTFLLKIAISHHALLQLDFCDKIVYFKDVLHR